jgi:hypothetical protein
VSVSAVFPDEPILSALEIFDSNVNRTIDITFELPWSQNELLFQHDFFTNLNYNFFVDRIFDNYQNHYFSNKYIDTLNSLEGYKQWVFNFIEKENHIVF